MSWLRNGLALFKEAELNTVPNQLDRLFLLLLGVIVANLCAFLLMAEPFAFRHAFWIALTSIGLTGLAYKLFCWSLKLTTHMLLIQSYALVM